MNACHVLLALLLAGSAQAETPIRISIDELAAEAGLSQRQVMMVLGSRTPYAEYRTSYARAERAVQRALGTLLAKRGMTSRESIARIEIVPATARAER